MNSKKQRNISKILWNRVWDWNFSKLKIESEMVKF